MHKKSTIILVICLCISILFSISLVLKIENDKKIKAVDDGREVYKLLLHFQLHLREATELYKKDLLKGEVLKAHRTLLNEYIKMTSTQNSREVNAILSRFCIEQMHRENNFTQEDNDHYMEIASFIVEHLNPLISQDDVGEGKNAEYTYWSRVYSGLTSDEFIKKLDEAVNP